MSFQTVVDTYPNTYQEYDDKKRLIKIFPFSSVTQVMVDYLEHSTETTYSFYLQGQATPVRLRGEEGQVTLSNWAKWTDAMRPKVQRTVLTEDLNTK